MRRVLEHAGKRGRHEGFAQADNIADDYAAALLKVARGNFYSGGLKVEKCVSEIRRDGKF